jgi:hypothetical protein
VFSSVSATGDVHGPKPGLCGRKQPFAPAESIRMRSFMNATVEIDAGICGFRTKASAVSPDEQNVSFDVQSDCEKIRQLGELLKAQGPFDAYQEIGPSPGSMVLQAARSVLTGCCAGCAVPAGLFKAMQVAAGLALPKDIAIRLAKE